MAAPAFNLVPTLRAQIQRQARLLERPAAVLVRSAKETVREQFKDRGDRANFQRTVGYQRTGPETVVVGSTHPGAAALEFGTKPYVIRARHKKSLAWNRDGSKRRTPDAATGAPSKPAKQVKHPGQRSHRWFQRSIDRARDAMGQAAGDGLVAMIGDVVGRRG